MMADHTKIEWADATWNPVTGCTVVSPGCTNCYAMKLAGTRMKHHPTRSGLTAESKAGPVWTGEVRFNEQWLDQPLRWKKPRMIFVCAHGDLFHENVPDEWIDRVFAVMALCPQHTFQVLTKRSGRMREYICKLDGESRRWKRLGDAAAVMIGTEGYYRAGECQWPLHNVWLGVSVEDQSRADERIPDLLATPAAVRWISAEPLLGPVDLCRVGDGHLDALNGIEAADRPDPARRMVNSLDWIVAGGESGPGARPMHPDWARWLRDQCAAAGVPFFFKQWGSCLPCSWDGEDERGRMAYIPDEEHFGEVFDLGLARYVVAHRREFARFARKGALPRLLDGVAHDAMPIQQQGERP